MKKKIRERGPLKSQTLNSPIYVVTDKVSYRGTLLLKNTFDLYFVSQTNLLFKERKKIVTNLQFCTVTIYNKVTRSFNRIHIKL